MKGIVMQLSFSQLIFCTAIFVSVATKAQDVHVWNKTNKQFKIIIESTDKTQNYTTILYNGRNYCFVTLPEKSICSFKVIDIEARREAIMNTLHGTLGSTDCPLHYFEISMQGNNVDINHIVSQDKNVTITYADQ
jgi:hypothetical protein